MTRIATLVGPDEPARYHLLLCHGPADADFNELVAASDAISQEGEWTGTHDAPLDISSIECDARLARWSKKTGRLALRITRSDPTRWWLAVHHAGERLFAMVYYQPAVDSADPNLAVLSDPELGRDPLLDIMREPGMTASEVRRAVASRRGEQLAAALAAGGVAVDAHILADVLAHEGGADGNVHSLLELLGCPDMKALTLIPEGPATDRPLPNSIKQVVSQAILTGCVVPGLVSTVLFVMFSRYAIQSGANVMAALMFGGIAAWIGMWGTRQVFGARRQNSASSWSHRLVLSWAADAPVGPQRPPRPTAAALDTWGGLFYLLRDIAFFGGIDRPDGPMALYVEAWGLGPPALVEALNRVTAQERRSDPLFEAARELIELRSTLIDQHLAGDATSPERVKSQVRSILRPVIKPAA